MQSLYEWLADQDLCIMQQQGTMYVEYQEIAPEDVDKLQELWEEYLWKASVEEAEIKATEALQRKYDRSD